MLNLPSSDSENIRKMENLHVESSFEKDKASDEDGQDSLDVPFRSKNSKRHHRVNRDNQSSRKKKWFRKRVRTSSFDFDQREHLIEDGNYNKSNEIKQPKNLDKPPNIKDEKVLEQDKTDEKPEITHKKLEDAEYKDLGQRYKPDEAD